MNITDEIAELEKKLAQLREQERAEKEEAKAKARQEREADLRKIKDAVNAFNKKHDEKLILVRDDFHIWHDKLFGNIVDHNYIEV